MVQQNIFISSDNANSTTSNNVMTSYFQTPYEIPATAKNISVYLRELNIVNFFINISEAKNNNKIYFTTSSSVPQQHLITVEDGAYDLDTLVAAIKYKLSSVIASTVVADFNMYGDDATQKVVIKIPTSFGVKIPAAMANLIGFVDDYTIFNSTTDVKYYYATSRAKFNPNISLIIASSITSSQIYQGQITNVLATVAIDAPVGSLITYKSSPDPLKIYQPSLQGSKISQLSISIYNQVFEPILITENFTAIITIEYTE